MNNSPIDEEEQKRIIQSFVSNISVNQDEEDIENVETLEDSDYTASISEETQSISENGESNFDDLFSDF